MSHIFLLLAAASFVGWSYLLLGRGRFWRADQRLPTAGTRLESWPEVVAIVPARNESAMLGRSLMSLRRQDYAGRLQIVLVDDQSVDNTAAVARRVGDGPGSELIVVDGCAPPRWWGGKVWAMAQGVEQATELAPGARYLWFTDADVEHDPDVLSRLVERAERVRLDLVSTMVMLHCAGLWERLLVPAFVFFFQKLYPFPSVNDPSKRIAAAAGGSMLVRRSALARAGGLARIRRALIDDCALGTLLKRKGRIWLGLTESSRSLRPYGLRGMWTTVSRTAFTELDCSRLRLTGATAAMLLLYLVPVAGLALGLWSNQLTLTVLAAVAWISMGVAYAPTLRLYGEMPLAGILLPAAAILYLGMTLDSARKHWRTRVDAAPRWSSSTDWRV
jgi:hopene-associated glycosyltransferase HpnB